MNPHPSWAFLNARQFFLASSRFFAVTSITTLAPGGYCRGHSEKSPDGFHPEWNWTQIPENDLKASSVKEVANAAGFNDYPHFCCIFRKKLGASPGKYGRMFENRS
jgi:AraC-like DNA-binding protein